MPPTETTQPTDRTHGSDHPIASFTVDVHQSPSAGGQRWSLPLVAGAALAAFVGAYVLYSGPAVLGALLVVVALVVTVLALRSTDGTDMTDPEAFERATESIRREMHGYEGRHRRDER